MVKDVICGMDVDPVNPPTHSTWQGKQYYFCSEGCKQTFDAAPENYASAGKATSAVAGIASAPSPSAFVPLSSLETSASSPRLLATGSAQREPLTDNHD